MAKVERSEGRNSDQIRSVTIETNVNRYAEGSVIIKSGNTHVLCTASVEESVPRWRKDSGLGWVSAEYSMLPRATNTRNKRDREKVSGRTQEIQRLIGRALRATVDFKKLGERSIIIDCDVLQADGGTRTASITGGYVALAIAVHKIKEIAGLKENPLKGSISAISIGMKDDQALADLDYDEDSTCDVDMNFVMTETGDFVEVQGTAEGRTFSKDSFDQMTALASTAGKELHEIQNSALKSVGVEV